MKILYVLCSVVLLFFAIAGVIWWIVSFEMLRDVLTNGSPVVFPVGGHGIRIPGMLFGLVVLAVPAVFFGAGGWLLAAAFKRKDGEGAA
jgi:hypothetical protein